VGAPLLSRQQLATVVVCSLILATLALSCAAAQAPGPPPLNVAPHKTEAVATVKSLRTADDSTGIGADLGEDIVGKATFTILRLRIHTFKALTAEGTPIANNEVIEAVTRDPVSSGLLGKKIEVEMEERGNTQRHRWLITKLTPASSQGPTRKQN
jgi:hypothetical protein